MLLIALDGVSMVVYPGLQEVHLVPFTQEDCQVQVLSSLFTQQAQQVALAPQPGTPGGHADTDTPGLSAGQGASRSPLGSSSD